MGIHQRGKSNSIKDLLVKIARREYLERKNATLARSTYGDYRSMWLTIQAIDCIIHP